MDPLCANVIAKKEIVFEDNTRTPGSPNKAKERE